MTTIELSSPLGERVPFHVVTVGDREWFFSYQTCVAYRTDGARYRRAENYSVTTARHMRLAGVADWPKLDDAAFETAAA